MIKLTPKLKVEVYWRRNNGNRRVRPWTKSNGEKKKLTNFNNNFS